jgi:hypothetical protein
MNEQESERKKFFSQNPYADDCLREQSNKQFDYALPDAILAVAFELYQMRVNNLNVDARIFDGDTEGWSE